MQTVPSESPEKVQESGLQILQNYLYSHLRDNKNAEHRVSLINGNADEIIFSIYPYGGGGGTLDFVLAKGQLLPRPEQAIDSSDTLDAEDEDDVRMMMTMMNRRK